jgi:molecular chaperone DnaK
MTTLIQRNTTIPTRKSEIFSTAEESQMAVDIHVLQGERPMAADNVTLGVFRLEGIPAAPRGIPQIEVAFDIDANGILNVSATDKATGKSQKITITATTNLTEADVERMVKEAEHHSAEDQRRRELIEARNLADQVIYQTEKSLGSLDGQAPANLRQEIETKMNQLREAMTNEDVGRIRQLTQELQQASMEIGESMYQADNSANGAEAPFDSGDDSEDEDIVEGEFEAA